MSSPRWIYLLWIGCVRTSAMPVPAGTVTVVELVVTAAWELELSCRLAGGVCADCCAKLHVAIRSVLVRAMDCLVLVLNIFKKAGERRRRSFGDIGDTSRKAEPSILRRLESPESLSALVNLEATAELHRDW